VVSSGGNPRCSHDFLGKRFASLKLRRSSTRPEHRETSRPQLIGRPSYKRSLRPNHHKISCGSACGSHPIHGRDQFGNVADPWVTRRTKQGGYGRVTTKSQADGMLAAPAAKD
jgi:hypothetical protein